MHVSCKEKDDVVEPPIYCNNPNYDFQGLVHSLIKSGYTDKITMDVEVHEYSFTLTANKEVCMIGYQSQPTIAGNAYTIEVLNDSNGTVLYSGSHVFSSTQTSYVVPNSVINLKSGTSYTVRRIQTNYTKFRDIIGRLVFTDTMNFPYSNGIMTITTSDFYGSGGPATNSAIPYIDLIFN
ncbi:MAG TPA: hypothetical protein DCX54_00690 [Flavobacteriales bacterium]|nr:hypothetical protein [Flavobacteriales bacterium]